MNRPCPCIPSGRVLSYATRGRFPHQAKPSAPPLREVAGGPPDVLLDAAPGA